MDWHTVSHTKHVVSKMQRLFTTLSEEVRRRYAAIEVLKLPHGGPTNVSGLFKINAKTVHQWFAKLDLEEDLATKRIQKRDVPMYFIDGRATLDENFRKILIEFTAADPMLKGVL